MAKSMHKSIGTIKYSEKWRLTVEVDQELADYYRSLIPKWIQVNRPRWDAHVTVVRPEKEEPVNKEHWGKYQGEKIEFLYDPIIHFGKVYYWLNVWCVQLEEMRLELGLPVVSQYTLPPVEDSTLSPKVIFRKPFHCTIANIKII